VRAAGRISKPRNRSLDRGRTRAIASVRAWCQCGPLRNKKAQRTLIEREAFRRHKCGFGLSTAFLKKEGHRSNSVVNADEMVPRSPFELCRAFGDAVWSGREALGPITHTKSARQKFQRAFAQESCLPLR